MTHLWAWALFGCGAVSAALCGLLRRGRPFWALLAAVCIVSGMLGGLALGAALSELLPTLLAVCAVSMTAALYGKGGGA